MLAYFPETYPDELLYSVLARYHGHVCSESPKRTLDELFGNRNVRASAWLQSHLRELSERIPRERGLTPALLATEFTLYPYFISFEPPGLAKRVYRALVDGPADAVAVRLGIAAGMVPMPERLRYCPDCKSEMIRRFGQLYWRRSHQLPGVLVCCDHGVPLVDSDVWVRAVGQHEFAAADELNTPLPRESPAWIRDVEAMRLLKRVATRSAKLLTPAPTSADFALLTSWYQSEARARGFEHGKKMSQKRIRQRFVEVLGPIISLMPGSLPREGADDWPGAIVRKHRKAFHPLRHILFRMMLDETPLVSRQAPFGDGPWPCLNPLNDHYRKLVVRKIEIHRESGQIIGRFSCSCGYNYSLGEKAGSKPRVLAFGAKFYQRLRELTTEGKSLRATARELHVDAGTVRYHSSALGLQCNWKPLCRSNYQSAQSKGGGRN